MSVDVSWFCYCDDCDEKIDSGTYSHRNATEARQSAQQHGAVRRKMRDGKMYDFCEDCWAERMDGSDYEAPEKKVKR